MRKGRRRRGGGERGRGQARGRGKGRRRRGQRRGGGNLVIAQYTASNTLPSSLAFASGFETNSWRSISKQEREEEREEKEKDGGRRRLNLCSVLQYKANTVLCLLFRRRRRCLEEGQPEFFQHSNNKMEDVERTE